ncbi:DUF6167 family protein [Nocardioides gilvus]|uniref:DUF6167 family protein n=1 Tax=Nocardioides gilvus TaxID=1735589 RepID=UPI000D749E14|nr:DUF6167 family protein [Nocardioides gilvus]
MSRGLWFVAGAGAGVYAMSKARRLTDSVTTEGLRARWHGLTHAARLLGEDVRSAQATREVELRESFGLAALSDTPQLQGPQAPQAPQAQPGPTLVPPLEDRKNDH